MQRNFASDNNAGMSPEALKAFMECNQSHQASYGDDEYTEQFRTTLRTFFEVDCDSYLIHGGTGANCLGIGSALESHHAVLCHSYSHMANDECHAPGFFNPGVQLRLLDGDHGKINPGDIAEVFPFSHGVHGTHPGMISITQSTEAGTVYTLREIQEICRVSHELGLIVHMDGARFFNALVTLDCTPAEMSWKAGIDLLSLGGVKNGLGFGESLVCFKPNLLKSIDYRIKQTGHLVSKMRFLSAPWIAHIESGEWKKNARNSNAMARLMASELIRLDETSVKFPVQANAIFTRMEERVYDQLFDKGWRFYDFPMMGAYRLMTAWDTNEEDIEAFISDLEGVLA